MERSNKEINSAGQEYKGSNPFKDRTILGVGITVEKAQYLDLEKVAAAAFSVD